MRTFEIDKEYWNEGEIIFNNPNITIKPGYTPLVGCNGSGKTTLLLHIESKLHQLDIPHIRFNNLSDGGNNAMDEALNFTRDLKLLATLATSSEGENIMTNIGKFAEKVGNFCAENQFKDEVWILIDAMDSGLSIDNAIELKHFFDLVIETNKKVYIVAAINTYEFARGEECFDVYNGEYITFNDYEDYRNFVIDSKEIKKNR